jgi:adenine phosphoribosyltransferase
MLIGTKEGKQMATKGIDLKKYIRNIPDWPKKGILFRDITPLLADPEAFAAAIDALCAGFTETGVEYVAAVEARGFIFGSAVAEKLGAGFVPIRKKGKLPFETESVSYDLEYGTDTIEVHRDAVGSKAKVIGGQVVGIVFLVELADLRGREKLADYKAESIISYE